MSQKDQSQRGKTAGKTGLNSVTVVIVSVILAVVISFIISKFVSPPPKIAYIDTAKIMVGFNEAARIDRELKEEDDKCKKQLKELKDSLSAHIDLMGKEYDKANLKRKKDLQTMLSIHNQNVNNFREANKKKMEKLQIAKQLPEHIKQHLNI